MDMCRAGFCKSFVLQRVAPRQTRHYICKTRSYEECG